MKHITTLLTILFISLLSSPSWSETVTLDDLVERNDLYFEKFTNTPFTGEVSGKDSGKFKKGQKNGEWLSYYKYGQLYSEGNYKDGKQEGFWFTYHENGKLRGENNYKDGQQEGRYTWYYENGQLRTKGNWKDGKEEGLWEYFNVDGSLKETRTYKNGRVLE